MPELSEVDHRESPPRIAFPPEYNAAHDLLERNLRAGRSDKVAFKDDAGSYTYGELLRRVDAFAHGLLGLGLQREERALLCLLDTLDFPTAFLGCLKAGVIPIPVNTLLTAAEYGFLLRDSGARALVVSAPLLSRFALEPQPPSPLAHVVVSGGENAGHLSFRSLLGESDVVFSAAKLFFAYGLGNALTFPLAVGATALLMAERPSPAAVFQRLLQHRPTVFFGVPTLYAALLASPDLPGPGELGLRHCVSAGEALPAEIGRRWRRHFGIDIIDGLGSTEMLHIFLSNRPGHVRYGTTGRAVPGYELRLQGEAGETGELQVLGPTRAAHYWNNPEKTRATFEGGWTRSGDKYGLDQDGYYVYAGRSDDMLKVAGQYVSPVEVESALISHDAVLEAAVVGREDADGLVKPAAYVVLKSEFTASVELGEELKLHVKSRLAPFKHPRFVEFVSELPKTATGKIQRFKLRAPARP